MVTNNFNSAPSKLYSIVWSELGSSLISTAQNLRNDEGSADVTVSAGGKIFFAHKLILSAASPLLMQLLRNTKCHHPILMLAGISAFDFETILDFAYKGEINIGSEKLPSLLQAAQILDVRALSATISVLNTLQTNLSNTEQIKHNDNTNVLTKSVSPKEAASVNFSQKRKKETSNDVDLAKLTKTSFLNDVHQVRKSITSSENTAQAISSNNEKAVSEIFATNIEEENEGNSADGKKIISDLPVKCKFCGVIIRQSRNLRRHIDQMHSKPKPKRKPTTEKENNMSKNKITPQNVEDSTTLDFSEDSFTLLTNEILKYSARSESFPDSQSNSCSTSNTSLTDTTQSIEPSLNFASLTNRSDTHLNPEFSSLKTVTNLMSVTTTTSMIESKSNVTSSVQQFQTSTLHDSCEENVTLKDLENQLFSACFCSTEGV